jgi:hypothetical protein
MELAMGAATMGPFNDGQNKHEIAMTKGQNKEWTQKWTYSKLTTREKVPK